MKKLIPIIAVISILAAASYFLLFNTTPTPKEAKNRFKILSFTKTRSCSSLPKFLYKAGIKRPIIDLSQDHYTGIAFYYGIEFKNVLHKKSWEKFEHLGTYTIDKNGDIYLTPNPFISIKPTTFNLQKAIYKMDSSSGELQRWLEIDDIKPTSTNPYGLISLTYNCDDKTIFASAIDKSNYKGSKGRIYHINPKDKSYEVVIKNFDALTLRIIKTTGQKLLLAGNALDNSLYAFELKNNIISQTPHKILSLPNPQLHIRKIKVIGNNKLKLEAIKFSYSLVAATQKKTRFIYTAKFNPKSNSWSIKENK